MLLVQSPQYSNSSKADLFRQQRSPSLRQRVPSMQECLSSHHLRPKADSPSEIRRRKSQHDGHTLNSSGGKRPRPRSGNNYTQELVSSVQDLKEEFKTLHKAYKELCQEKLKNIEELTAARAHTHTLTNQLQQAQDAQEALRQQVERLEAELREERAAKQQLQTDLYFLREKAQLTSSLKPEEPHFEGSEQIEQIEQVWGSQSESNILSFSLTSSLEDSLPERTARKREHVKVVSNLPHFPSDFENVELKPKKEPSFKKPKKESLRIDLTAHPQPLAALNPLTNLLSLKSPTSDKKPAKPIVNSSNSKRKKEEKENLEPKAAKKKSRKLILQSPLE